MPGSITDDDAFMARAEVIAAHAREGLLEHRKHASLVFLWLSSDELRLDPLQGRLESERRAWARVAREVAAEDARGVLFVGEGWADDGEGALAQSLIAAAVTRSGRARTETTTFRRARGRPLVLGTTRVLHEPASFLDGVRRAWSGEPEG